MSYKNLIEFDVSQSIFKIFLGIFESLEILDLSSSYTSLSSEILRPTPP
jgi:hypothetical protein